MVKDNKLADQARDEGNSYYKQGKFQKALISYNQSLCFAKLNSKQTALAYANRSAVYLEVKLFSHCLENIKLAHYNKHPNPEKLIEREKKCKELMTHPQADPLKGMSEFLKLSYAANEKIPFIVNCLELHKNQKYGRFISTNQSLNIGDVVAVDEASFMPVLGTGSIYTRCSYCFSSNMLNLIPCSRGDSGGQRDGCVTTMFCSQKCSLAAQKWQHKIECNPLLDLIVATSNLSVRTTLKQMTRSLEIAESVDRLKNFMESTPKTIFDFDLRSMDEESKEKTYLEIVNGLPPISDMQIKLCYDSIIEQLATFPDLNPYVKSDQNRRDLLSYTSRLILISIRNQKSICAGNVFVGAVFLPFGSMLNHSCDPNVCLVPVDNKVAFIAIKPIAKGEQLFISYGFDIFTSPDRGMRRAALLKHFEFECTCPACVADYRPDLTFTDRGLNYMKNYPKMTIEEILAEFKEHCEYYKKDFKQYPSNELLFFQKTIIGTLGLISAMSFWPFEPL